MSNTPYFDEYERNRLLRQSEKIEISPNHCKKIEISTPTGNPYGDYVMGHYGVGFFYCPYVPLQMVRDNNLNNFI